MRRLQRFEPREAEPDIDRGRRLPLAPFAGRDQERQPVEKSLPAVGGKDPKQHESREFEAGIAAQDVALNIGQIEELD